MFWWSFGMKEKRVIGKLPDGYWDGLSLGAGHWQRGMDLKDILKVESRGFSYWSDTLTTILEHAGATNQNRKSRRIGRCD